MGSSLAIVHLPASAARGARASLAEENIVWLSVASHGRVDDRILISML